MGLGAAVDFLSAEVGRDRIVDHDRHIMGYALHRLSEIPGLRVFGPRSPEERCGAISFTLRDIHPHDLATILDSQGVAIRAGHHCTQPLMRRLAVPATARASFYLYNDENDVEALAQALLHARRVFGYSS